MVEVGKYSTPTHFEDHKLEKEPHRPHLSSCVGVLNDVSGFPLFICICLPFDHLCMHLFSKKEKLYACTMFFLLLKRCMHNVSIKRIMFLILIFLYISFSLYTCVSVCQNSVFFNIHFL